jgi:hypothetical protein
MKIRIGFVSNSSSSSFLIYVVCLSESETQAIFGENKNGEGVRKKVRELGLKCASPCYDAATFIGMSWDKVAGDETGNQFKARVEALIQKLGITKSCGTHEEAWNDG